MEDVVRDTGSSRRQLERRFREHFGDSIHHYLQKTRVQLAIAQIASSKDNMETIAEQCGFRDAMHMARTFQTIVGKKPLSFRSRKKS